MHQIVVWFRTVLVPWLGPSGLFLACFVDSSFFSLPEVSDLLVVSSAAARPESAWIPVLLATLGSVAGSATVWLAGEKGGEPYLVRRFGQARVDRTRDLFERWDLWALALPAMLPPPVPFKIFVFSAGVFGVHFRRFARTLLVARGLRYIFWAGVGVVYGEEAEALLQGVDSWFIRQWPWLLAATVIAVAGLTFFYVRRRRRGAPEPPSV